MNIVKLIGEKVEDIDNPSNEPTDESPLCIGRYVERV